MAGPISQVCTRPSTDLDKRPDHLARAASSSASVGQLFAGARLRHLSQVGPGQARPEGDFLDPTTQSLASGARLRSTGHR